MSLLDEADYFERSRPGRGLVVLRAYYQRCKDALEGRVPPHKKIDEKTKRAVWKLRRHVAKLPGEAGLLGMRLIEQHIRKLREDVALSRAQQRKRHGTAMQRRLVSPLQVRRFVIQYEAREGGGRGAVAAAAVNFDMTPDRISRLLKIAEEQRETLLRLHVLAKTVEEVLDEFVRHGSEDASEQEAATRLASDVGQLLRRLPPRI